MNGLTAIQVRREFNKERIDKLKRGAEVVVQWKDCETPVTAITIDKETNRVLLTAEADYHYEIPSNMNHE